MRQCLVLGTLVVALACAQSDDLVRSRAVRDHVFARGVKDEAVLSALRATPRESFLDTQDTAMAYADGTGVAADGQIVPSTYLVGLVLSLARPQGDHRVLEYGTGTGYQAAVLAKLAARVHSMDGSTTSLAAATERWKRLGITNVDTKAGGLNDGWAAAAPFDLVILWNAPPYIPAMLTTQLQPGGRMVVVQGPLDAVKQLRVIEKGRDRSTTERVVVPVAR